MFSNVLVGAGGTITFTFTANTNITSPDYAWREFPFAAFNGLQLAAVSLPLPARVRLRLIRC